MMVDDNPWYRPAEEAIRVTEWTLQQLNEWAEASGFGPDQVMVDYAGCGSHEVELWVRNA